MIARRLMYWQVYLHKTVLAVEQMLIRMLQRAKELTRSGVVFNISPSLDFFLHQDFSSADFKSNRNILLHHFALLDDVDITAAAKYMMHHEDKLLAYLAKGIVQRRLFKLILRNDPFDPNYVQYVKDSIVKSTGFTPEEVNYLVFTGTESNRTYSTSKDEIKILFKSGEVRRMSQVQEYNMQSNIVTKHYLCYPKGVI